MVSTWQQDVTSLRLLADELATLILDCKQAEKAGLSLDEYTSSINTNMDRLKSGIASLESTLEKSEQTGSIPSDELRKWELAILDLSKNQNRLEYMYKPESASIPINRPRPNKWTSVEASSSQLDSGELLQLQNRMIDEQDIHLDILSESIQRQKAIGMRIGEELELHVDLLEETEAAVDETTARLGDSSRRLNQVSSRSRANSQGMF
ncbi:hypothetical protein BC829DRAFT_385751 [Chytridium lagenaria]|nr:hypothetical protein BC829DRAFT_385751 [Chytridium lagenaria]